MLSLAGMPLTGGFTGKFFLVSAGIGAHLWLLVLLLVFNSAVGLFYYVRVIVSMTSKVSDTVKSISPRVSLCMGTGLTASLVAVIWLGVYPTTFLSIVQAALTGFGR